MLDLQHSHIRLLSIKNINQEQAYLFYFEGRDQFGELCDFDPDELSFKTPREIAFDYFRDDVGIYYFRIFFKNLAVEENALTVFLRGHSLAKIELKHQERLVSADIKNSQMRVLKYANNTYHFELVFIDSQGDQVKSSEKPEFLIEGEATLKKLYPLEPGKWAGELRVSETNSIIYLSVRLNSNHLPRLLRIQHIEK